MIQSVQKPVPYCCNFVLTLEENSVAESTCKRGKYTISQVSVLFHVGKSWFPVLEQQFLRFRLEYKDFFMLPPELDFEPSESGFNLVLSAL